MAALGAHERWPIRPQHSRPARTEGGRAGSAHRRALAHGGMGLGKGGSCARPVAQELHAKG